MCGIHQKSEVGEDDASLGPGCPWQTTFYRALTCPHSCLLPCSGRPSLGEPLLTPTEGPPPSRFMTGSGWDCLEVGWFAVTTGSVPQKIVRYVRTQEQGGRKLTSCQHSSPSRVGHIVFYASPSCPPRLCMGLLHRWAGTWGYPPTPSP